VTTTTIEQYYCPRCESAIPHEHIERRPIEMQTALNRPRHLVLGWCEHCTGLWQSTRELVGGTHYEHIAVEEITDERTKRPYARGCQRKHGFTPSAA